MLCEKLAEFFSIFRKEETVTLSPDPAIESYLRSQYLQSKISLILYVISMRLPGNT